jgi:ferrous iron transport protein B
VAAAPKEEEKQKVVRYGETLEAAIARIEESLRGCMSPEHWHLLRWFALKLLEGDTLVESQVATEWGADEAREVARATREKIRATYGDESEVLLAEQRYGLVAGVVRKTLRVPFQKRLTFTSQLDSVLTHTFLGIPLFLFFMWALFQLTFVLGSVPQGWMESGLRWLTVQVQTQFPPSMIRDLVTQGVLGGVGGVVVFLPTIFFLFLGISILEDTGYMARAAFLMDRVMHTMGLHGKSFVPLLMGFGCNVPAIMATRTLETRRDRLLTNLIIPLMSCSARFYVYVLFASAFFPGHEGNVIFSLYLLSILVAIGIGQLLGRTVFREKGSHFVLELPPYRLPTGRTILLHVWTRCAHFLKKVGGYILAFSIIIWFLGSWPSQKSEIPNPESDLSYSALGRFGNIVQPVFEPLGFTREMTIALVGGTPVKEAIVSTLGVIYGVSSGAKEGLRDALERTALPPLVAYAYLIFVLFYAPCIGTIVAFYRETGSKGWTVFSIAYQFVLAWGLAFVVVQGGRLVGLMG